jgi:nucleotide-binding universal stress UspA family protein
MKTIVCGVDGSPGARAALRVAASIANEIGARLVAVHVLDRLADVGLTAERVAASVLYEEVPDARADGADRCGGARRTAAARHRPSARATDNARRFPMTVLTVPGRTAVAKDGQRADNGPPIVAAIDGSAASHAAIAEAVRLGVDLDAPIVFLYVRRGPAGFFGAPVYQRRLTKEMSRARRVLDRALAVAASAGVDADAEILEGSPRRRIPEFARDRHARLVVVGSRRPRLGRSVSRGVVGGAGRPVVVAKGRQRLAVAGEAA